MSVARRVRLLLARRRPIRLVVWFIAAAVVTVGALPVMEFVNPQKFRAPTLQVRSLAHVAPYPGVGEEADEEITLFEPGFRISFDRPETVLTRDAPPPVSRQEVVELGGSITTPAGGKLRLVAVLTSLHLSVNRWDAESSPVSLFGADLKQMSAGDRNSLEEKLGRGRLESMMSFGSPAFGNVALLFEESGPIESKDPSVLYRDAKTGWAVSGGGMSTGTAASSDGTHYRYFSAAVTCPGTSSLDVWMKWRGRVEEIPLSMIPGPVGTIDGQEVVLKKIVLPATPTPVLRSGPLLPPVRDYTPAKPGMVGFEFSYLPIDRFDVVGHTANPMRLSIPATTKSSSSDWSNFCVQCDDDALTTASLTYVHDVQQSIFQLPFIPGFPEENRSLEDFTEARIPPGKFGSLSDLESFLGESVQAPLSATSSVGTFPMSFEESTVGAMLEQYRDMQGPHELSFSMSPSTGKARLWVNSAYVELGTEFPKLAWCSQIRS